MNNLLINNTTSFVFLFLTFLTRIPDVLTETERHLQVSELTPLGQHIGFVTENPVGDPDNSNFYVVFPEPDSLAEKVLSVNDKTGEITLIGELDYETETKLTILAIPTNGTTTIKVIVNVLDENDNAPTFPVKDINLEISEYARIDTELALPSAVDPDSPKNSVKKYSIFGGNVNNVFRLSTNRLNSAVYVDLVVNGQLDREYRDRYDLVIEVVDGGDPPKKGTLNVHVQILDANDNAPEFLHSRYSASLLANVSVGTEVATIQARDADAGDNAKIGYRFSETLLNPKEVNPFKIDPDSGLVTAETSPLTPGNVYELIVVAYDHGVPQSLESTAFLTINIQNPNSGLSRNDISVVWLTEDGSPNLSEGSNLGYVLARVSVREHDQERLFLTGTDVLCLKETDTSSIYLMIICGPVDRESTPELHLKFLLRNTNNVTILEHPVIVEIQDVNDNPPKWNQTEYRLSLSYNSEGVSRSNYRLLATDPDYGENSRIRYSLENSAYFKIDPETGLLTATDEVDCNLGKNMEFTVIATDNGHPPLSSAAKVLIDVVDAKATPPVFEKSLYEMTVREDADISTCLLQVNAHSNTCGDQTNKIRYAFKDVKTNVFKIDPSTGKICLQYGLDYEKTARYQLTVVANDAGEKTTSTLVNVIVEDVNDNNPVFEPQTYNLTVYEDLPVGTVLLHVQAVDRDVGSFGEIRYHMESDGKGLFHIDSNNGRLYSDKPLHLFAGQVINLKIWAKDSGDLTSIIPANVQIQILDADKSCPYFTKGLYEFTISEDILPGIVIGTVEAVSTRAIAYSIVSDQTGKFNLDPKTGKLMVAKEQDADFIDVILLNIEARASDNCASFSQIQIRVHDVNDNAPEFDMNQVESNVAEDFPIHEPFFAVQAIDKDKHENGKVTYELIKSEPACPIIIRPLTGQMLLAAPLDYEKTTRYKLTVRAQDQGIPPKSSLATIYLNVLDVNDNAPEFESQLYDLEISEDASLMTELIQLRARDKDSGDNSKVRYRFADKTVTDFGINEKTGEIFVKQNLDRESIQEYSFLVLALDKGNPPMSSNASIHIRVLDVNDNTPNCTNMDKLKISVDMDGQQTIGQLDAHDPDAGLNGSVLYRLQQFNEFIDVKPNGEVVLRKKLRGMQKSSVKLGVIAEDQGDKPRSVVCTVQIDFDKTESNVSLIEPVERTLHINVDDEIGTIVTTINASNAVSWSIESHRISSFFNVKNGVISTAKSIDETGFSKPQPLTVAIGDADKRKMHLTFIVRLHHQSTPDNETIVTKLREQTVIGTKVLTFGQSERSVTDKYYSVVVGNPAFEVDEKTGNVYLSKRLEFNNASDLQIEICKNDLQHPLKKKDMTLIFELDDANNHSPIFVSQLYLFNLSEATPTGTVIGQVEATDNDMGLNGVVKYRFLESDDAFSINVETGEIFLQKPLHHHIKSKYHLVVEAEDSAVQKNERKRRQCLVQIDVIDSNDNPPMFLSSSSVTVKYTKLFNISAPIHYFVASDVDQGEGSQLKYKIISGNVENDFRVDANTGALFLARKLRQNAEIIVRALDGSSTPRFADQKFTTIIGQSSMERSYFDEDYFEFKVPPNTGPNTFIYKFLKNSVDSSSFEFHILPVTQREFVVDEKEGILMASTLLDQKTYHFILYATSSELNQTDYASVVVKVGSNATQGPKIAPQSCGNVTVVENMEMSNLMRVFHLQEPGSGDSKLTYHIESGAETLFSINEKTGVLSSKELDYEARKEHFLIISVADDHKPRRADVCTIRVMVTDENDNIPRFNPTVPQVIEISDVVVAPALILKLTATDLDGGDNGRTRFSILDDPSGSLDVDPDTGDLIFARDYAFTKKEFILKVGVADCSRSHPLSSEKQIRVLWKRSTKGFLRGEPKFLQQKYIATVLEGQPKGANVLQVETSNKVFNDMPLSFNILEGNDDYAFEIDEDGVIKTAEELDYEIQRVYTLKIVASGKFTRSPETIVEIHVLNVNDNSPAILSIPDKKLYESLAVGSFVVSVSANDVDGDSVLEYSVNPVNDHFYIEKYTGHVHLKKQLDYETEPVVHVGVQVFDGVHAVRTNFTVLVLDTNDNAPKFSSNLIKINVPASSGANSVIGKVIATDVDEGQNGQVTYELLDGTKNFKIDRKTGQLLLLSPLKVNSVYFITVKASDSGLPKQSSIATIKLKTTKHFVNESPQFTKDVFSFLVDEDYPVYLPFGAVEYSNQSVYDVDINFCILDEEYSDLFGVTNDGQLFLAMPIDREAVKEHRFRIGINCRDPTMSSAESNDANAVIIVQVVDVNDNQPMFAPESTEVLKIDEQMKKGTIVGRLSATDLDSGENSRIVFSIKAGNEFNVIRVEPNSGAIIFDHWDDECLYETPGINTFNVTFIAEDNGVPSKWTSFTAHLVFDVDNWSGTAPMFAVPAYHKYIAESAPSKSVILKAQAHNRWDFPFNNWRYSIQDNDELFDINVHTGEVILRGQLDYEKKTNYEFTVSVRDAKHRSAIIPVQLLVLNVDEFAPVFSKSSYKFYIPLKSQIGQRIGNIYATDNDHDSDGKVVYSISSEEDNAFVGIDPDTGVLILREPFPFNKTMAQIVVIASSGMNQHSRAVVNLELASTDVSRSSNVFQFTRFNKWTVIVASLFIGLLLLLCLVLICIYCKSREQQKPHKQIYSVARGNVAVMADINRSSPSFVKIPPSLSYERPKTFSLISSNSSDQNSNRIKSTCTNDGFGAGRSQPDSGIDPDALSINSNVTDYLLQLGVTPMKLDQLQQFSSSRIISKSSTLPERMDPDLGDISSLIYAKVDEVLPSARMTMSSYHPVDLSIDSFFPQMQDQNQRQGLTYHPLTEVFSQIAKIQQEQK